MDAAGPVDGANGRAVHEVLGNRFAIPTAPTAQTEGLSNGRCVTQSTRPPNRGNLTLTRLAGKVETLRGEEFWKTLDELAELMKAFGRYKPGTDTMETVQDFCDEVTAATD